VLAMNQFSPLAAIAVLYSKLQYVLAIGIFGRTSKENRTTMRSGPDLWATQEYGNLGRNIAALQSRAAVRGRIQMRA
jgi:hypothetical protein